MFRRSLMALVRNKVTISNFQRKRNLDVGALRRQAEAVIDILDFPAGEEMHISLCGSKRMRDTNAEVFGKREDTDVISVGTPPPQMDLKKLSELGGAKYEELMNFWKDRETNVGFYKMQSEMNAVMTPGEETPESLAKEFDEDLAEDAISMETGALSATPGYIGHIYLSIAYIEDTRIMELFEARGMKGGFTSPEYKAFKSKLSGAQRDKLTQESLSYYVIHGACHLAGYDHEFDEEYEEMLEAERDVMAELQERERAWQVRGGTTR